jgi:hypothetical protein
MAISSAAAWSDTTDIIASATPTRVTHVRIRTNPSATSKAFVQLFDSADATPGTTAPDFVIGLPAYLTSGNKPEYNVMIDQYFATGLTWFVSTTHDGATAATTSAPLLVDVHYAPGG